MKKKYIWMIILGVALLIAIGSIVIYKEVASNNIERKTYEFLRTKGYTNNDIDDVEVKHSFINKILSYNEWRIFVEFEVEEDIIFAFTYRNDEIIIQGVKSENYQLTKEEIINYETRFENGELKQNVQNIQYKNISILKSDHIDTKTLIMFDNVLYGKSFSVIDYAGGTESIGKIDKLIDSQFVPMVNGETNTADILNALVYSKTDNSVVVFYNNEYVLFEKIR